MVQVHKKNIRFIVVISFLCIFNRQLNALSSLTKNDGFPVFTTLDPQSYLYTKEKLKFKDPEFAKQKHDFVSLSISPYGQNANCGRNIEGEKVLLSDLSSRWNMLALLFGKIPEGCSLPPTLQDAFDELFPGLTPGTLDDLTNIDPNEQFGFVSFPLEYRKRGVRFELQTNFVAGFGLSFQTGIASMRQTVTGFIDHTCEFDEQCPFKPTLDKETVKEFLTSKTKKIADEICFDLCNFCETSIEEIRLLLFWRQAYELNRQKPEWPHVLVIPFFEVGGSLSPGKEKKPCQAFGLPFGNNDHTAVGFTAGINFDFIDTIEIGGEIGATHFFDKSFEDFRIPTSQFQRSIYPFATHIEVSPGLNWHFGAKFSAYHFLEHLSFYFQYLIVEHKPDTITLKHCDEAFLPCDCDFEKNSSWKMKVANIAFNYDISPNVGLGFLWQAPLSQRNTYRSTTIMFSFFATF